MDGIEGARVLVVEDQMLIAMSVRDALEEHGCVVVGPVGRLEDAKRLAEREALDAALLDIDLNGEASYPVARVLAVRGVPFALLTGYDSEDVPADLAEAPVLEKPVPPERLARVVRELVGEREGSGTGR